MSEDKEIRYGLYADLICKYPLMHLPIDMRPLQQEMDDDFDMRMAAIMLSQTRMNYYPIWFFFALILALEIAVLIKAVM